MKRRISMRLKAIALMIVSMFIAAAAGSAVAQVNMDKLLNPAQLNETAPDKYKVIFDTSKGEFIVEVTRAWAPNGADRFYNLVKNGFYDNCKFYRNIEGFMVQFGINGNPKVTAVLSKAQIQDDPVKQSNTRGHVTFAKTQIPNSRTTQVFVNYGDNSRLDKDGFAPFGKVTKGMNVVESLYNQYGGKPGEPQAQGQAQMQGNVYLEKEFPKLDFVKSATIVPAEAK
jgi:peptidyl-prolyl cis-trans isomerase A (cyclophilin A)